MKIALIGTHGTGKTTIAHDLVAQLKKQNVNAGFLGEIARQCPFPINKNTTKESQEWIIYNQYIKELELQRKYEILVCDRSILDGYVYYYNKFRKNKLLENFVKENSKKYDLMFKVPIKENYLKEDGVRETDKKFQINIDKKFDYLLKELKIPFQKYKNLKKVIELINI